MDGFDLLCPTSLAENRNLFFEAPSDGKGDLSLQIVSKPAGSEGYCRKNLTANVQVKENKTDKVIINNVKLMPENVIKLTDLTAKNYVEFSVSRKSDSRERYADCEATVAIGFGQNKKAGNWTFPYDTHQSYSIGFGWARFRARSKSIGISRPAYSTGASADGSVKAD